MTTIAERAQHIYDVTIDQYIQPDARHAATTATICTHIEAEMQAAADAQTAPRWIPVTV